MGKPTRVKGLSRDSWSHISRCVRLLSKRGRILYFSILVFQCLASILDLVGLGLIMKLLLDFQSTSGSTADSLGQTIPIIDAFTSNVQEDVLLGAILLIFILKGAMSLILHSINIRLLARETIHLVEKLSRLIFAFRTSLFKKLSSQDISYTLFNSSDMVLRDTLVPVSVIFSDAILICLVCINLFFTANVLFFPTVAYFLIIFITLRRQEKNKTKSSFRIQWQKEVSGRGRVQETLLSLRELYVSTKLNLMLTKFLGTRSDSIKAGTVVTLAQLRPKYFYEMALFGGIGVISLVSQMSGNKQLVLPYLVLFVVSASRMIPSLMRIQYYLVIFQKSKTQTDNLFEILEKNQASEEVISARLCIPGIELDPTYFSPQIKIEDMSFRYDSAQNIPTIDSLNLKVSAGEMIAIVGPSGSGKSTLIDLLLGYHSPDSGQVYISDLEPRFCFSKWPGKVAYVPQKVPIYEGTLYENIAVGAADSNSEADRQRATALLAEVEMEDFLRLQKRGLDSQISELGANLSGGQIQRIGIARALFSEPSILVLDETTSSLDSATEHAVMSYIHSLRGKITIVIVAHRLSTIRTCDRIYYLDRGQIKAQGNFDEVRKAIPDFENQVKLLEM
jgi:ATP-binding cassette subfamily C protein